MADSYVYRHRVGFDETNLVGNVYFAHYLHWQGRCREYFLADHAKGVLADLDGDLALVTVACAVDFYAESRALDRIEVRMSLDSLVGNRIGMRFDYVRTEPGPAELVAHGRQTVAYMRRVDGGLEPGELSAELRGALDRFATARTVGVRP